MRKIKTVLSKGITKGKNAGKKLLAGQKEFSRKKKILVMGTVVLIVGGGVIFWGKRNSSEVKADSVSVMAIQAETGTISNSIVGTGNLESSAASSVTIPSGIVVEKVNVEEGDQVAQGDVLATVSISSVYSAMEEVQETIEELDEEIEETGEFSEEETISSKVSGRIKEIYMEEEENVSDIMLEKGSLLVISLDGKMAVELQVSREMAVGDTVTVRDEEGNEVEGEVESVQGKTCVITMGDRYIDVDEQVTVLVENEEAGKGTAYIHQKLSLTGTTGTISQILVSKNQVISSGEDLYTVLHNEGSVQYQEAVSKREAYAKTLTKLIGLAKSGEITAQQDGIVESVLVSDSDAGTSSQNTEAVGVTNMSYNQNQSLGVTNLSYILPVSAENPSEEGIVEEENPDQQEQGIKLQLAVTSEEKEGEDPIVLKNPVTGEIPQNQVMSVTGNWEGTISWTPVGDVFAPAVSYQAQVVLTASEGYYFETDSIEKLETGILSGIQVSEDGRQMMFVITFPETENVNTDTGADTDTGTDDNTDTNADTNGSAEGNTDTAENKNEDTNTDTVKDTGTVAGEQENTDNKSNGSANSNITKESTNNNVKQQTGTISQVSSQGTVSAAAEVQEEESSSEEYSTDTAAFTISGMDEMMLSVSVDELDINSVEEGQTAQVTFDALEDETAQGEVTSVNSIGTVNGGVARYEVKICIPRTEEMKVGMNASATIVIEEKENVVTIPVTALQERQDEVYVYTETDEEGNLSGEVSVTTGLSDGTTVEITEGLQAGDTVYYQKTGAASNGEKSEGMMDKAMGDMGERNMPQGDFGGNSGDRGGNMAPPGN